MPGTVTSVLFVCHGNIRRSPFAEMYVQSLLKGRGPIENFRTCFRQIVRCYDSLAEELVSASRNMVPPPALPHPSKSL